MLGPQRTTVIASTFIAVAVVTVIIGTVTYVEASNVLFLPVIGKSHVFSMVAMADSLAARGHSVTVVVGQNFPLDTPEAAAGQQRGVHYERFVDFVDDYDAWYESVSRNILDNQLNMKDMLPSVRTMY
jgi:hypothetical protein